MPRCPACGFLLASAPGPVYQNSLPPQRPRPAVGAQSSLPTAVMFVGFGVALAITVVGFLLVRQRDNQRAALPAPSSATLSAAPASSSTPPAVVLEPTTLFAKAKAAALGWHADATLIAVDIAPVSAGKVDPSGKLGFTFGKPAGKKLGPGAPVQSTGFVVNADATGARADELQIGSTVSIAEPNCIFEDLVGKIEKLGIPSSEKLHLRYALSDKGTRGVWRVFRVGESQVRWTLDGANCAIIVH
jgi:hypothetical protein